MEIHVQVVKFRWSIFYGDGPMVFQQRVPSLKLIARSKHVGWKMGLLLRRLPGWELLISFRESPRIHCGNNQHVLQMVFMLFVCFFFLCFFVLLVLFKQIQPPCDIGQIPPSISVYKNIHLSDAPPTVPKKLSLPNKNIPS